MNPPGLGPKRPPFELRGFRGAGVRQISATLGGLWW